jgi:hypothetical protein
VPRGDNVILERCCIQFPIWSAILLERIRFDGFSQICEVIAMDLRKSAWKGIVNRLQFDVKKAVRKGAVEQRVVQSIVKRFPPEFLLRYISRSALFMRLSIVSFSSTRVAPIEIVTCSFTFS